MNKGYAQILKEGAKHHPVLQKEADSVKTNQKGEHTFKPLIFRGSSYYGKGASARNSYNYGNRQKAA